MCGMRCGPFDARHVHELLLLPPSKRPLKKARWDGFPVAQPDHHHHGRRGPPGPELRPRSSVQAALSSFLGSSIELTRLFSLSSSRRDVHRCAGLTARPGQRADARARPGVRGLQAGRHGGDSGTGWLRYAPFAFVRHALLAISLSSHSLTLVVPRLSCVALISRCLFCSPLTFEQEKRKSCHFSS